MFTGVSSEIPTLFSTMIKNVLVLFIEVVFFKRFKNVIPATQDTGLLSEKASFWQSTTITAGIPFLNNLLQRRYKVHHYFSRTSADREVAAQDGTSNYQPAATQESKHN